jgi:hypothetical protein
MPTLMQRAWRRIVARRVSRTSGIEKKLGIDEARLLAATAKTDFAAQMTAGKTMLYGSESRLSVVVDAERCFRRAMEIDPGSAEAVAFFAHSLDSQGRWTQAKSVYEHALALDPTHELARNRYNLALEELNRTDESAPPKRQAFSRYPETIASLADLEQAVIDNVLSHLQPNAFQLTKATKIVTVGSCFAANLANALKSEGIVAVNLTVGEVVNSTFANLEFFRWAFRESEVISEEMSRVNRDTIRDYLSDADLIIYTLGVAPCFFEKESGHFLIPQKTAGVRGVISGKYVFRNTTVEENVRNIGEIVTLIRRVNPKCDFVFSLSPVPLSATLESRSSMEADCLSKSILRVAVEQVVVSTPRSLYWPAFEIVRWLGPYVPDMYGEEDGTTSHISERVIRLIIGLFLRTYLAPQSG